MTIRVKARQKELAGIASSDHPAESGGRTGNAGSTRQNPSCDTPEGKKIVIVDDHPVFRKGLEQLVNSEGGFAVCGEAANAGEAMAVIRRLNPDLAIVDLSLPTANGIELIKNIRAEFPRLPILVLSMHDESLYALRALRAGANGYIMKHEAMANVIHAIHEVFNGRPYLSPAMAAQVITKFARHGAEGEVDVVSRLSDRELEILELIGKGNEVRQIAKQLHLSPKTVETHRAHIKDKLDLKNAREVARFALQWLHARGV
ncbi:MAG TPA: response regulator transcription factor [Candidatus Acidoferrales bacterium]|jgi:DNA-binding NarL/FixJ family response regulator|nr:response regulator transcription factor [Candidatus Acidoferrales bacterium]